MKTLSIVRYVKALDCLQNWPLTEEVAPKRKIIKKVEELTLVLLAVVEHELSALVDVSVFEHAEPRVPLSYQVPNL